MEGVLQLCRTKIKYVEARSSVENVLSSDRDPRVLIPGDFYTRISAVMTYKIIKSEFLGLAGRCTCVCVSKCNETLFIQGIPV